ncbi:MAG: SDR family NAD(P)-dependent oxidoreductase, partial [Alistipes sp.]
MKDLRDKVIVITGASSGIGEAMAREYAAQGAKVVLGARNAEKLAAITEQIGGAGGAAAWCAADVVDPAACKQLIDTGLVKETLGLPINQVVVGLNDRMPASTKMLVVRRVQAAQKNA